MIDFITHKFIALPLCKTVVDTVYSNRLLTRFDFNNQQAASDELAKARKLNNLLQINILISRARDNNFRYQFLKGFPGFIVDRSIIPYSYVSKGSGNCGPAPRLL